MITALVILDTVADVAALVLIGVMLFVERRANHARHEANAALLLAIESEARTTRHALRNVALALRMDDIVRSLEHPDLGVVESADGREKGV